MTGAARETSAGLRPSPAPDLATSPWTGWTREHWTRTADDMLASAERYRSPGGGLIDLPGRPSRNGVRIDGIEGFARTFLLAAFRHVGDARRATSDRLDPYLAGALAATDPRRSGVPDSWPPIGAAGTRDGQLQVEAASIALGLHLTRDHTWDRMSDGGRDQVDAWMRPALQRRPHPNNWYLFPLTVASFLEAVGRGDAATSAVIDRGLELLELWYRGDGWYTDGTGSAVDHYNGWAMHYYPVLHAHLRGDQELRRRLGDRLEEFLGSFALTFDRNGAPLHMGRSLTYRWAALAAVELGQVTGRSPLTPGQSRRIMSTTLRYFLERGALQDGLPTLGWHGPHDATLQRYSGPASPFWASKGFTALMLPEDHALWTDVEQELRGDSENAIRPLRGVGLLVQSTATDGLVRVHNHGSHHLRDNEADAGRPDPLYARLAYSTRTGPTDVGNPSDNDVQLLCDGGWSTRRRIHPVGAGEDWVSSWHVPVFPSTGLDGDDPGPGLELLPEARITCLTVARGEFEVRAFGFGRVPTGSIVRVSGWAVAAESTDDLVTSAGEGQAAVRRRDGSLSSTLTAATGPWTTAGVARAPAGTAFGRWAAVPSSTADTTGSC